MSERKKFLLRIDPRLYSALEKWAADDLRSVNSQIEYVLADALRRVGRTREGAEPSPAGQAPDDERSQE